MNKINTKKVTMPTKKSNRSTEAGNTVPPHNKKDPQKSPVKNWCFTYFFDYSNIKNIDEHNISYLLPQINNSNLYDNLKWISDNTNIKYYIYQIEQCPTTRKLHYQGYIQLNEKKRLSWLKKNIHSTMHFEEAKGDANSNNDYCSKNNTRIKGPWKNGNCSVERQRSDLESIACNIINGDNVKNYRTNSTYIRNYKYFDSLANKINLEKENDILIEKMKDFKPTHIQLLLEKLLEKQHKRQVLWVWDENGNKGKSEICHYIKSKDVNNVFLATNNKHADLMHMYNGERIILFDYTRAQEEQINYSSIEQFKTGNIFKTKYESLNYVIKDQIKIMILANFEPDYEKLSKDRWFVVHFDQNDHMELINKMPKECTSVTKKWKSIDNKSMDVLKEMNLFEQFCGNEKATVRVEDFFDSL